MNLEQIGFYTLSDRRAACADATTPLSRCEIVLTGRCNFKCPYCRRVGGKDLRFSEAISTIYLWAKEGLKAIRFSGGEPTLYPRLGELVTFAKECGIERIAISTNGSSKLDVYKDLIERGVNDISVSLDACCAADGDKMAGGIPGAWEQVVANIRQLTQLVYVTVGIVVTDGNIDSVNGIIQFAASLGVADIRVIPAAQDGAKLSRVQVDDNLLEQFPILKYRVQNMQSGRQVRGLRPEDNKRCPLVLDDMAVNGGKHFPCIIYMREGGAPIGDIGPLMRFERQSWYLKHDCQKDPICANNCLDVCVDYNNRYREFHTVKAMAA